MSPKVTILIPQYQSLELIKLCLRSIRKKTAQDLYRVIVIDNDSRDQSLDYLRTLKWITLLECQPISGEKSDQAEARALDLGLQQVQTPYVVTLRPASIVLQADWLTYLLQNIEASSSIAAVGMTQVKELSLWMDIKNFFEWPMHCIQALCHRGKRHTPEKINDQHDYLQTHCALYRVDLLRKYGLNFFMGWTLAGKVMHQNLIDLGYDIIALPSEVLHEKIEYICHAEQVLCPSSITTLLSRRKIKKIQVRLHLIGAPQVLMDESLDL